MYKLGLLLPPMVAIQPLMFPCSPEIDFFFDARDVSEFFNFGVIQLAKADFFGGNLAERSAVHDLTEELQHFDVLLFHSSLGSWV